MADSNWNCSVVVIGLAFKDAIEGALKKILCYCSKLDCAGTYLSFGRENC